MQAFLSDHGLPLFWRVGFMEAGDDSPMVTIVLQQWLLRHGVVLA